MKNIKINSFDNIKTSTNHRIYKYRDCLIEVTDKDGNIAYGSDIDEAALEIAQINAKRAGVERKIRFKKADIRNFEPKSEKGTVICNPPYGERLLDIEEAQRLYKIMGEKFVRKHGWAYYVISPSEEFEKEFGRKADKRRKLYNGMIKCQLFMYFK